MERGLPVERLLAIIHTQTDMGGAGADADVAMALVASRARELLGADAAAIEAPDGEEMVCRAGAGAAAASLGLRLPARSTLSGLCAERGVTLCCADTQTDRRMLRAASMRVGARSIVCVPVCDRGSVVVVLEVYDRRPDAFSRTDVTTLELLCGMLAAQLAAGRGGGAPQRPAPY